MAALAPVKNDRSLHLAPSRQEKAAGRPLTGRWHPFRQNHRQPVPCQMNYLTTEGLTIGTLIDLSPQGWQVVGKRPVMPGATLSTHVYLSDQSLPLNN